ncbi:DUF4865 family protein [Streptomyces sp. NA04227]|uniref:DUF4865 family protein n=1 Tax=Streptomyces sp. NA04227 TaxID=2742136 RepID=UPI00159233F2|nr:DUF4865 family protein [Streptomyces sp. NA04227]QKW05201.1 DUF4865 family protein [Streptomyces sp. NA04227]
MQAMQYEITLPADYDMGIIRHRVATRGHLLDDFPGLGLKAYLVRENGVDGSPVNQYAPFYLWNSAEGMNTFLWEGGFGGIVRDFGRPAVRQWTGLHFGHGPAAGAEAVTAVRHRVPVPAGPRPDAPIAQALTSQAELAREEALLCTALAVDTSRWELVHFSVWTSERPSTPGDLFRVAHLSTPESASLSVGRHW